MIGSGIVLLLCLQCTIVVELSLSQSPYTTSWSKDALILGSGVAAGLGALIVDHPTSALTVGEINQLSRSSINRFDRSATYNFSARLSEASDVMVGLALASPVMLFFDSTISEEWKTVTIMYIETMLMAASVPSLAKGGVERKRPYAYNEGVPMERKLTSEARRSFFSRHATLAFASSVFLSSVYSEYNPDSDLKPYVWAGSLLTAAAVGYLRYESGEHFPTDVLTGAIIGGSIGYLIPLFHKKEGENISIEPSSGGVQLRFSMNINR